MRLTFLFRSRRREDSDESRDASMPDIVSLPENRTVVRRSAAVRCAHRGNLREFVER